MSAPEQAAERTLTYAETLRELRKTRRLYESGKISIHQWCASVHRIIAAFERGRGV